MLDHLVKTCLNIVIDGKHNEAAEKRTPWPLRLLLAAVVILAMTAVCTTLVWLGDRFNSPILYILAAGLFLAFASYTVKKIRKFFREREENA